MSLKTWKAEFYPVAARKVKGGALKRLRHSLRKWEGVLSENCEKHDVNYMYHNLGDNKNDFKNLLFATDSCALCQKYYHSDVKNNKSLCYKCPIVKVMGEPCDKGDDGPYFSSVNIPNPMIYVLKECIRIYEEKKEKKT